MALTKATRPSSLGSVVEGVHFPLTTQAEMQEVSFLSGGNLTMQTWSQMKGTSLLEAKCASFSHLYPLPLSQALACVCSPLHLNVC